MSFYEFDWIRAATPPLVAAPPVPPVVPDSEASDHDDRCESEFISGPNLYGPYGCADRSGSGVVPDKPALAPRCTCTTKYVSDITGLFLHETVCPLSVPAVTDDEAATKVIYDALDDEHADYYTPLDDVVVRLVQRLRSAGFLIVHHTKET